MINSASTTAAMDPCDSDSAIHCTCSHECPHGGKTGICLPRKLGPRTKISGKREISNFILLISWVNSCNDSLFVNMTLTLHKSQVHCFGNLSLQFTKFASLPAEAGCETGERIVLPLAFVA